MRTTLALAATVGLLLLTTPATAAENQWDLAYPTTLSAVGQEGSAAAALDLPPGTTPTAFTATLTTDGTATGSVLVSVGDQKVSVPADEGASLLLELGPEDLNAQGQLLVTIRNSYDYVNQADCTLNTTTAQTLDDMTLTLNGQVQAPKTVADFFNPTIQNIDIVVPAVNAATTAASLQLASALGWAYPNASIEVTKTPDSFGDLSRTVVVQEADKSSATVTTSQDTPTLTLLGSGPELAAAARALVAPANALANSGEVQDLGAELSQTGTTTLTLSQAGASSMVLAGRGQVSAAVGVDQSRFNPPVGAYQVHVEGTYTPAPGQTQARANLLWNNQLLASILLEKEDTFVLDGQVADPARAGQLIVQLETAPVTGNCSGPGLGMRVDVNVEKSTVTAVKGQGLPEGFGRFPQVTSPTVPVAFGTAKTAVLELDSAAQVLVALARVNPTVLQTQLVSFEEVLSSGAAAVVIGAGPKQTAALEAPLRMENWRAVDAGGLEYTVSVEGDFAALEAYVQNGRDLLVLAHTAGAEQLANDLAAGINTLEFGWASLDSNLYIGLPGEDAFTLNAARLVPQEQVTSEFAAIPTWVWIIGGLVLAGIAGRVLLVMGRKRRMSERLAAKLDVHESLPDDLKD